MSNATLFKGKVKLFFQEMPLNLWVWEGGMEIKESVVKLINSLDEEFLKTLEVPCREMARVVSRVMGEKDYSEDQGILSMLKWTSINVGKSHRHPNPAPDLGWNIEGWTPNDWGFDDGFVINFEGSKVVGWYTKNIDIEGCR